MLIRINVPPVPIRSTHTTWLYEAWVSNNLSLHFQPIINQLNYKSCDVIVERIVGGWNFVGPSDARTQELLKKLRWSRLTSPKDVKNAWHLRLCIWISTKKYTLLHKSLSTAICSKNSNGYLIRIFEEFLKNFSTGEKYQRKIKEEQIFLKKDLFTCSLSMG